MWNREACIRSCGLRATTIFWFASCWAATQPLLDEWAAGRTRVQWYEAGSHGPEAADRLLDRDGLHWLPLP